MAANTLCQFLTQTGFREPLDDRARQVSDEIEKVSSEIGRFAYDVVNPPTAEDAIQRLRLAVYFAATYAALC